MRSSCRRSPANAPRRSWKATTASSVSAAASRKIRYDNGKTAVARVTGHRTRQVTREFQRLQSHYLFEPQFCLVHRANEKGHVERLLDFARENYLVPVPQVESLGQLNALLAERCHDDLVPWLRGKTGTKAERLEEERSAFLSLPSTSRGPTSDAGERRFVVVGAVRHEQLQRPGKIRPPDDHRRGDGRRSSADL